MARRDRTDMTPATAVRWLVMLMLIILGCIAAVSYLVLLAPAAQAIAPAALIIPSRVRRHAHVLLDRLRCWRLKYQIAETRLHILQYQQLLLDDSIAMEHLEQTLQRLEDERNSARLRLGLPALRRH
jgi:hypothetical protein